jgi:WD40 repeat protein
MSLREDQKIANLIQNLYLRRGTEVPGRPAEVGALLLSLFRPRAAVCAGIACLAASILAMAVAPVDPHVLRTPDPVESLAFSSDGTVLAAGFDGRTQLIHIPPDPGRGGTTQRAGFPQPVAGAQRFPVLGVFQGPACALRSPVFSPTSLLYYGRRRDCAGFAGSQNSDRSRGRPTIDSRQIPVFDLATGRVALRLGPHAGYLTAIRLSADGRRLASASDDGQVRVWSLHDGRLERSLRLPRLTEPRRILQPYAFDPALELIAMHDWRDYYMVLIELASGEVLHKTEYPFRSVDQPLFVFARDGDSYFDGRRIRASRSGAPVSTIEFNFALIPYRAAFSPDGRRLAVLQRSAATSGDGRAGPATSTIEVYTVETGALYSSYTVADRLESIAWHPVADRPMLAVGGYSGRVYLREFDSLP